MVATPWVEKYRPRTVGEISHQTEVVNMLTRAIATNNLPHMLFYGPPGTGKTTTALAVAHQLYGPEASRLRVMELNASDERGIAVVRHKIKAFAAQAVGAPTPGYPSPPYKLIILDEADSMTQDAQNALRRTMELSSRVTRFVLCCNYVSRIIEPLASRCAKFRFQPLTGAALIGRLRHIAEAERVKVDDATLGCISAISGGDMRKAITTLQSAARLSGAGVPVDAATVTDVAGVVPEAAVVGLLGVCRQPRFDRVQAAVLTAVADGYPTQQLLAQLGDRVTGDVTAPDMAKAAIFAALSEAEGRLCDGADETLQLLNVCGEVQTALQAKAGG